MKKLIIKYVMSVLFVFSAFTKIADFNGVAELFSGFFSFGILMVKIFVAVLIITELVVAYLIAENFFGKRAVFNVIFLLILFFTFISLYFAIEGYDNCGCFGTIIITEPIYSVLKNVILLLGLIYIKKEFLKKRIAKLI